MTGFGRRSDLPKAIAVALAPSIVVETTSIDVIEVLIRLLSINGTLLPSSEALHRHV